jgi:hypothetical protein
VKLLLVSNSATERCGVAQYGRHMLDAAMTAGIQAASWHSTPAEPMPDPDLVREFDVVHVNWHAAKVGHLKEKDFETARHLSVFVHEPSNECPLVEWADLVVATEEMHMAISRVLPPPCLDYFPQSTWDGLEVTLGSSGIRRDGLDWVEGAIDRQRVELMETDGVPGPGEVNPHAWRLCPSAKDPDGWLSDEAEIERLAQCALNVFHYHSAYSGQSYAVMMGVAARRPLLVNHNRMLRHIWDEEGVEEEVYVVDDVAEGIHQVVRDLREGRERRPLRLAEERSWSMAIEKLRGWWEEILA